MYAKMYIDKETGKSLFELHKNQYGKGIRKFNNLSKDPHLEKILKDGMTLRSYNVDRLKHRLIVEGYVAHECGRCGFNERRVLDYKVPLLLNFKDGNKGNWKIENIELVCYNCYFLYIADIFTKKQKKLIEDIHHPIQKTVEHKWDLDDFYLEHLQNLGLMDDKEEKKDDGSEYISKY